MSLGLQAPSGKECQNLVPQMMNIDGEEQNSSNMVDEVENPDDALMAKGMIEEVIEISDADDGEHVVVSHSKISQELIPGDVMVYTHHVSMLLSSTP